MLVLQRKVGEKVIISKDGMEIELVIVRVRGRRVSLGFTGKKTEFTVRRAPSSCNV